MSANFFGAIAAINRDSPRFTENDRETFEDQPEFSFLE
jgi:hypothetical protein